MPLANLATLSVDQEENNYPMTLDYIESNGNQYIDTGIVLNSTQIKGTIDFQAINDNQDDRWFVGAVTSSIVGMQGGIYNSAFYTSNGVTYSQTNIAKRTTATFTTPSTNSFSIYLFARNVNGNTLGSMAVRIYSAKFYNGNTLLRDFVPSIDPAGVVCMYDNVSGTYFYNQGSGNFTTGLEPKFYLDRVQSTGLQYIDTGFMPTVEKMRVRGKLSVSNTACSPFGSQATGSQFTIAPYINSSWNIDLCIGNNSQGYIYIPITSGQLFEFDFSIDNGSVTAIVDGTTYTNTYTTPLDKSTNVYIFGNHRNGVFGEAAECVLEYIQFYDGDTLSRDYVPCLDSNGVACLWDKVNNMYYHSATGYELIAGEVV